QFLVESVVLTVLGAAVGLGVAQLGLNALIALAPADIPRLAAAGLDGRVFAFTLGVCGLVALGFGLVPALQARRLDIQDALKAQAGRSVSEGRGGRQFRSGLVVTEVALAVTLVVGAGLLLRSLQALRAVDPGFRTERVLKAQYDLPQTRYGTDFSRWPDLPEITNLHSAFLREVRALPGVESAALASPHPLNAGFTNSFVIVGREAESQDFPEIRLRFVTPGYLRTLDVLLLRGRALDSGDVVGVAPVAMINHTAAERYFADAEPIGQQIRFWGIDRQIVGVIGDERFHGVDSPTDPAAYVPLAQAPQTSGTTLLVRAGRGDPTALAPAIRVRLAELDPQLALYGVEALETTLSASIARPRFTATLLALFAGVAIVLALIGVHAVLSYTMARRAPELGIRLALGASRAQVLRLVVGEGVQLAAFGVALGLLGALAGGRLLASLLFGVSSTDPATFAAVAVLVLATAALASWLPARRALRIDPMRSLRAE
ncbi:MAG: ABC transporter permease, partial [Longimicrobiales bacterium]